MPLPNELLLDILCFLDYNSIVTAKFVNSTFLSLITQYTEEVARRRHFAVLIQDKFVTYHDDAATTGRYIRYDSDAPESFAEACQRIASIIGQHIVDVVQFIENTWNRPYILAVFAVSAVKYASNLELFTSLSTRLATQAASEAFFGEFARLRSLYLDLNYADIDEFHWTLLRLDALRGLNRLKIRSSLANLNEDMCDELVRYCSALPQQCGKERLLDLSIGKIQFPATFVKRLINTLIISDQHMTLKLQTQSPLVLDADELQRMGMRVKRAPSNGGTARRYSSDSGGITVDVDFLTVVIRTTRCQPGGSVSTS